MNNLRQSDQNENSHNEIIEKKIDWTLGCISLSTKDITDLYQSFGLETTKEILE
jgi:lipoprotein-anchoring transpeptidase ErfK/SrfK